MGVWHWASIWGLMALQWRDGAFALVPETRLYLCVNATGEIVDWPLRMRRLPPGQKPKQLDEGDEPLKRLIDEEYTRHPTAVARVPG